MYHQIIGAIFPSDQILLFLAISVKLYKCEHLVTHCGNCLTLNAAYNCGWCNDRCSLQKDCASGWLPRSGVCGDPVITRV